MYAKQLAGLQACYRHWRLRSFQLCWGLPPMQHSADFNSTCRELICFVEYAERVAGMVVVDAFCGVGGNAVHFAQRCKHVIGVDICATRLALAAQNARVYGVADRLDLICTDYFDLRGQLKANLDTVCLMN
jgi:tRNA/tmRNA/rRNA uracil-C5-methylase (TrmA/RlmC/RlmD family)